MSVRLQFAVLGMFVLACSIAQPITAKELEEREWIEVRTPNFRIYSNMDEADSLDLAKELELFHVAIAFVSNIGDAKAPIPTEIFAFRQSGDMAEFGISLNVAGLFMPRMRKNFIFTREVQGDEDTGIIIHEYVHFLMRNHSSINYPRWYSEGLAEYLSAEQNRPGKFVIGGVQQDRLTQMTVLTAARKKPVPIGKVIAPTNYEDWDPWEVAMFYAESWALVHYLHHRPERKTLGQDMARYLELLEAGENGRDAFSEAFGISMRRLEIELERHFRGKNLPVFELDADQILPEFEPEVSSLSREEISLQLADAALALGEPVVAKRWYSIANTDERFQAEAQAGLGDLLKFDEEYDEALPYFERAISLAPDNPYVQLDMAEYWHDRARDSEDEAATAGYLKRARKHYVQAWKLDNTMPETYAMYGHTYLLGGQEIDKAVDMLEQAEALLPSNIGIRTWLAEAYAAAGRNDDAIRHARSVLAWSHEDSEAAKTANEILEELGAELN